MNTKNLKNRVYENKVLNYEERKYICDCLDLIDDFNKAQIITGGRLNGRTYAYKCGLVDGKRKALEQQPSGDCVSRQAVLDEIKSMSNTNPSYWATCDVIDREDLIDSIKDLPSYVSESISIERIKQAIQVMDDLANHKIKPISFDQSIAIDMCVNIIKRLIKESEDENND